MRNTLLMATNTHNTPFSDGIGLPILSHTPFGHIQRAQHGHSLIAYNGEHPELISSHYLLGHGYRAYNPILMRFHSPDSASPFGRGGINSYAYVLGDPINNLDPSGHTPLNSWKYFRRATRSRSASVSSISSRSAPIPPTYTNLNHNELDFFRWSNSSINSTSSLTQDNYFLIEGKTMVHRPFPVDSRHSNQLQAMRTVPPLEHLARYTLNQSIDSLKEAGLIGRGFKPRPTYLGRATVTDFINAAEGRSSSLTAKQSRRALEFLRGKPYNQITREELLAARIRQDKILTSELKLFP
jgi:RHS repeat-associated protein